MLHQLSQVRILPSIYAGLYTGFRLRNPFQRFPVAGRDGHLSHLGQSPDRFFTTFLNLHNQRTERRGEVQGEPDLVPVDLNVSNRVKTDQVISQFRLLHRSQGIQHLIVRYHAAEALSLPR